MTTTAARKPATLNPDRPVEARTAGLFSRKMWLPKLLYDALPFFYVASGLTAFAATLYISEWFWVLPHYLLFSVACVHIGLLLYRRRQRSANDT